MLCYLWIYIQEFLDVKIILFSLFFPSWVPSRISEVFDITKILIKGSASIYPTHLVCSCMLSCMNNKTKIACSTDSILSLQKTKITFVYCS